MDRPLATCRSCGAKLFWATMERSGKTNPIDAEPVADGNLFERDNEFAAVSLLNPAPAGAVLYKSHFATCPNSRTHRKGK